MQFCEMEALNVTLGMNGSRSHTECVCALQSLSVWRSGSQRIAKDTACTL